MTTRKCLKGEYRRRRLGKKLTQTRITFKRTDAILQKEETERHGKDATNWTYRRINQIRWFVMSPGKEFHKGVMMLTYAQCMVDKIISLAAAKTQLAKTTFTNSANIRVSECSTGTNLVTNTKHQILVWLKRHSCASRWWWILGNGLYKQAVPKRVRKMKRISRSKRIVAMAASQHSKVVPRPRCFDTSCSAQDNADDKTRLTN